MRREPLSTVTKASRAFQWVNTITFGALFPLIFATLLALVWLSTRTFVALGLAALAVGIVSLAICTVEAIMARKMRGDFQH